MTSGEGEHLRVLLRHSAIQRRVREMGAAITRDFSGRRVHLAAVLKGASIFLADLVRQIRLEVSLDFLAVTSYGSGQHTSGEVQITKDLDSSIEGLNVILVEDILDTGFTVNYLLRVLRQRRPRVLRVAALLDKAEQRIKPVKADYVGFRIGSEFVVGYGLDYAERYRNLEDICVLSTAEATQGQRQAQPAASLANTSGITGEAKRPRRRAGLARRSGRKETK